ncbi:uncharacterized protein LOC120661738 isoform X2 [Panicum virgatum]|uniref:uncharacterized protein LOC120661738 isoform X2 n=1 Tax=Panicum virgatum TaxID=38727 RepID=UPI0019D594AB|nr:uncharacterized protein LOC120661738 isoform X2 [Panicum virgatum]
MDPLYISNVTDGIVGGVRKLEDLGVGAVLVNLLPPLGCAPLNTRADNYTRCEKDKITGVHNKNLMHKLRDDDSRSCSTIGTRRAARASTRTDSVGRSTAKATCSTRCATDHTSTSTGIAPTQRRPDGRPSCSNSKAPSECI